MGPGITVKKATLLHTEIKKVAPGRIDFGGSICRETFYLNFKLNPQVSLKH